MKLPFLQESKWPTSRDPEDREIQAKPEPEPQDLLPIEDLLLEELLFCLENQDRQGIKNAILALTYSILDEESESYET